MTDFKTRVSGPYNMAFASPYYRPDSPPTLIFKVEIPEEEFKIAKTLEQKQELAMKLLNSFEAELIAQHEWINEMIAKLKGTPHQWDFPTIIS